MKNKPNIRITSIPRVKSPGAAYHPMYYAKKCNDRVIPIPGLSPSIVPQRLSYSERIFKLFSLRVIKSIFLIELLVLAIIERKNQRKIFIHSFWYSVPFVLLKHRPVLVIHGSDYINLQGKIGKFILKGADVYIVGKEELAKSLGVPSIPNVFSMPKLTESKTVCNKKSKEIDFIFILRDALVKNPLFPSRFFSSLADNDGINIVVFGINGESRDFGNNSIKYKGVCESKEIQSYLARSKVFVLPSLNEGVPKALFEAMANDCSIIVNEGVELPYEIRDIIKYIPCVGKVAKKTFLAYLNVADGSNNHYRALEYLNASETKLDRIYCMQENK